MKKNILIALLLGVVLGGVVTAAPRFKVHVTKVYQNFGDTRVPFAVELVDSAWTQILSSDANRRYAVIEATSTANGGIICLSTSTTVGMACAATLNGQKIGLTRYSVEDYNEAALYGRSSSGSLYVVGEYQYDSLD